MANTPFLNLVKPTDTDQALITDINNNSDKIDTGVSTLSEQIAKKMEYDTISSGSLLDTINSMSGNVRAYRISSTSVTDKPVGYRGMAIACKITADEKVVTYYAVSGGVYVNHHYGSAGWTGWEQISPGYIPTTYYTPNITSGSTGASFANLSFVYSAVGKMVFISGRFQITDVGSTPSNNTVCIGLPSGISCVDRVGPVGSVFLNKTGVDISDLSIRQGNNSIYIQSGAGGSDVLGRIGTGYVMVYATILLS